MPLVVRRKVSLSPALNERKGIIASGCDGKGDFITDRYDSRVGADIVDEAAIEAVGVEPADNGDIDDFVSRDNLEDDLDAKFTDKGC